MIKQEDIQKIKLNHPNEIENYVDIADVYCFMYSYPGAMGSPCQFKYYVRVQNTPYIYHGNYGHLLDSEEGYNKVMDFLRAYPKKGNMKYISLGMGNTSFVQSKLEPIFLQRMQGKHPYRMHGVVAIELISQGVKDDDKSTFPKRNDTRWMEMYNLVKKYIEEYLVTPSALHKFEGENIGQWYRNQHRLIADGTIKSDRKELIDALIPFIHEKGYESLRSYVTKTGLLPTAKTLQGNQKLGKWMQNIITEYNKGTLDSAFIKFMNEISPEWMGEQTYIIGKSWVDSVPFGDLPITIVYPDKDCLQYMEKGIFGCYQLFEHFEKLADQCVDLNSEKYKRLIEGENDILNALFPDRTVQCNRLLHAIFGEKIKTDIITDSFLLQERVQKLQKEKDNQPLVKGVPGMDVFEAAIGNIFADSKSFEFADDEPEMENFYIDDLSSDLDDLDDILDDEIPSIVQISLDELLANQTKYIGKEVEINEELSIGSFNWVSRKAFYCYKVTGPNKRDYNVDINIEVFYENMSDVAAYVMIKAKQQRIKVKGTIRKYSNTESVYLIATEINGLDAELHAISDDTVERKYINIRQILAFPQKYIGQYFAHTNQLVLLSNDPKTKTMILCESTGEGKDDFDKNISIEATYAKDDYASIEASNQKVNLCISRILFDEKANKVRIYIRHWFAIEKDFTIEPLSIKMLLAFPERYIGKKVKVQEQLCISANDVKRKSFNVLQSVGDGKFQYNTQNKIEVFYQGMSCIDKYVMIDADYQKIKVVGKVFKYNNSDNIYIQAIDISGI